MAFHPRFSTLLDSYNHAVTAFRGRELFGTKKEGRWVWITYGEFAGLVDRFRAGLSSLGVARGDRVAVVSNNRVEWAVAAYACYGLGAAFVPMYEAQNPAEWEFIVRDCEAKVLLIANDTVLSKAKPLLDIPSLRSIVAFEGSHLSPPGAEAAANGGGRRIVAFDALLATGNDVPAIQPASDDLASLIYTSGTTGNPKGVMLTHLNLASNVSGVHELLRIECEERSLSFLPWAHVFGQTGEMHLLLSVGASMAISESVERILDNLVEVRPTVLFSVPRIFNRLYTTVRQQIASKPRAIQALVQRALAVAAKRRKGQPVAPHEALIFALVDRVVFSKVRARFGGRLRFAVSGGAALSTDVAEFVDALGIAIYEGYGLTETSPVVAVNAPGAHKLGSVGKALPGVRVDIDTAVDVQAKDGSAPGRVEGELVVHGPNVMKGYFKRPDDTADVLTLDGGLRTGDLGFIDPEGFVFITGRIKEQYKLENGKYVVPTALEEQLKLSPYIANVMVFGENKPYNVALIAANVPAVQRWAQGRSISLPGDPEAILRDERVRSLFKGEIEKYSSQFKGFESIRDFALIASDFTTDNGMLTPKMSVRRRKVIEVYGSLLDQLYAKKKAEPGVARSATT
jgi:long-chain acyl-CoA synthetase